MSVSTIDPKQLKKIRVQLGITQSELAKAAGVSQSLIAKLESGLVDPSFSTMKSISEALRSHIRMEGKKASDVMSSPVMSVPAKADVVEAARIMLEDKVGSLPVVEGGKVVGIVTETDVLRQICKVDAACAKDIAEIVVSYP